MTALAVWMCWVSIAFLLYACGGFVVVVGFVGLVRRRTVRAAPVTPTVSLIIAAYNEQDAIAARIENALALDYPHDRVQIIVASDGSRDRTERIVAAYGPLGVQLLALPRRGKIHALNAAVRHATGEILVFSDANTMCDARALRMLVRSFADPQVGGVAGHTSYTVDPQAESSSDGERLYWSYDAWLKYLESQTGSVVSAHGGFYAVRRSLYQPVLDGSVTDDFAISTAVVEQGYRLVFEPEARATEDAVDEAPREFRRRVRLMTRGLRGVLQRRRLLNPRRYGFYSFVLASHKIVRRLVPLGLVLLVVSSASLWHASFTYRALVTGQVGFYALAATGYGLRRTRLGRWRVFWVPFYFCMANAACALAWVQAFRGSRVELWTPQRHATGS